MKTRLLLWRVISAAALGSLFFGIAFILIAQLVFTTGWRSFASISQEFTQNSGRSPLSLAGEVLGGLWIGDESPQEVYRILLLGTDEVKGSNRPTVLTDTIMVVSYRPGEQQVQMMSIPRDIYLPDYQTKVNSLYREGLAQGRQPTAYPREALSDVLGVPFDSVVIVRMGDVAELIDLLEGIEVHVTHSFEDDRYPRDGVDVTVERDPVKLYETVRFEEGPQMMDGATAVKYARTRKSLDPTEGSDQARIRRQRQVIEALSQKLLTTDVLANPATLGKLYRFYADRYQSQLSLTQLGEILGAWQKVGGIPQLTNVDLPVTEYPFVVGDALFVHPDEAKYQQWVYEPVDPSWGDLQKWIQERKL